MEPNQEIQNETTAVAADDTAEAANGTAEATSEVTSANPMSGKVLLGALTAAVLAVFLLLAVFTGGEDQPAAAGSEEFATLAFLTTEGETETLTDFQGDALVVNFFASWCAPCRAELPEFEAVHLANGDAVRFVGVSHDLDEATWRGFVDETEITFETVFQPGSEIWTELDAKGMPSTAFVSPEGELLELWTGILSEELLQEKIDEHLIRNT